MLAYLIPAAIVGFIVWVATKDKGASTAPAALPAADALQELSASDKKTFAASLLGRRVANEQTTSAGKTLDLLPAGQNPPGSFDAVATLLAMNMAGLPLLVDQTGPALIHVLVSSVDHAKKGSPWAIFLRPGEAATFLPTPGAVAAGAGGDGGLLSHLPPVEAPAKAGTLDLIGAASAPKPLVLGSALAAAGDRAYVHAQDLPQGAPKTDAYGNPVLTDAGVAFYPLFNARAAYVDFLNGKRSAWHKDALSHGSKDAFDQGYLLASAELLDAANSF